VAAEATHRPAAPRGAAASWRRGGRAGHAGHGGGSRRAEGEPRHGGEDEEGEVGHLRKTATSWTYVSHRSYRTFWPRTAAWKACCSSRVTGPVRPEPILRPSISRRATTSAAVPHTDTSSPR